MADDKNAREKQARDVDRRQRNRDVAAELERGDEPEPPVAADALDAVVTELESMTFPATGAEIVAAVGDRDVETATGSYAVEELVPETDAETFDAPRAVRARIRRPTVAAAMKRVVEASDALPNDESVESQWDAYRKTFRALEAIDADDDDEGIRAIGDWIVGRIRETGELPSSRAVRRQAAKFCRANGYQIRNDDWLGV